MMIAQTGIDSVSSTAAPPAESASTAIWWLIPLAIACLALTWYLRRLNNATSKNPGRNDLEKRPSSKAKTVASVLSAELETPRDSDNDRQIKANKSSSKKKKKGQSKGQQNSKKLDGKQGDAKIVLNSAAPATNSNEKTSAPAKPAEIAIESVSASLPATTPAPAPVAAIFEPLRNVVPPRRKLSSFEDSGEGKKPQSVNEESVTRPASGGKFERMVPSTAYTRAAANRWPASMTNPVERPAQSRLAESKADSTPVVSVSALPTSTSPQPAILAAKGLKSFVSKVKSATSPDSVAAGNVSEESNATEGVQ